MYLKFALSSCSSHHQTQNSTKWQGLLPRISRDPGLIQQGPWLGWGRTVMQQDCTLDQLLAQSLIREAPKSWGQTWQLPKVGVSTGILEGDSSWIRQPELTAVVQQELAALYGMGNWELKWEALAGEASPVGNWIGKTQDGNYIRRESQQSLLSLAGMGIPGLH